MRVRVAYISSLGTTAILVAAALTLLTVVGAIVAYQGWPGSTDGFGVQSVPLAPGGSPAHAAVVRRTAATHRVGGKVPAHRARRASTAGLVKTAGKDKQVVPGLVMAPVHSAPPMSPQPIGPTQAPQSPVSAPNPVSDPGVPSGHDGPTPLPSAGSGLALPSLEPGSPPPPEQIAAVVSGLLSGGPPLPLHLLQR